MQSNPRRMTAEQIIASGMTVEEMIAPGGPLAPRPWPDDTKKELALAAKNVPMSKIRIWKTTELGVTELGKVIADLEAEGIGQCGEDFRFRGYNFAKLGQILKGYRRAELAIVSLEELGFKHGVTEATYSARVKRLGFEVLIHPPKPLRGDELGGHANPNPFYYWNDRIVIVRGK